MIGVLRSAVFIPESKHLNLLLHDFHVNRNHLAIVVDEYGRYRVRALTKITQFNETFGTDFPDDAVDTIGGLITHHFGRVPHRGEKLRLGKLIFEIQCGDIRQIHVLLVRRDPLAGRRSESASDDDYCPTSLTPPPFNHMAESFPTTHALPDWHFPAALLAGVANTLSFAPTPYGGWLQLLVFIWLFAQLARSGTRWQATLTGAAFGFGNFLSGIWWLYISMHVYGEMATWIAGGALVLFCLYLALYPALSALAWALASGKRAGRPFAPSWHGAFAFASAWALGEWARGTVFTGFPWLASGYPQVDGPFAGYAPLVGVYGIGWVLALFAALVVNAIVRASDRQDGTRGGALAPAALVAAGLLLPLVPWTKPENQPLRVRLLQGNVKQNVKFEQAGIDAAIKMYTGMITEKPADLVVTPETAIAVIIQDIPLPFAKAVRGFVDKTGTSVLFGAVGDKVLPGGSLVDYTNSLYGVTPGSTDIYRYDKHHLVPFGEFIPWGFHWFVRLMKMPLGDFARGAPVQAPFLVHNQPVMADICYEDIFSEEIAATVRDNAPSPGILVNITNLAWFGDTIALDQQLQIARMRSLETGRPMLRATNTGMTAAIDAHGRVIGRLKSFTLGSLDVTVEGTQGITPFVASGNAIMLAIALVLLAFGLLAGPRLRRKRSVKIPLTPRRPIG
ncbi:MAG: apolipoprotein N-acyltransferase [Burkholderia sp.]